MIPPLDPYSGNLPPGVHMATWTEVIARYGYNSRREALLQGLKAAIDALHSAGCQRIYIDGSFVTRKESPGDFDACWDVGGVNPQLLDPVLLDFTNQRAAQKAKYLGELFLANVAAEPAGTRFLEFFQRDRRTRRPKGIIMVELGGWS